MRQLFSLSPESKEERVTTLLGVHGEVLVVEVQNELFGLEAELLIEQHGRVTGGNVQRDVLPHTRLK